jgi:urea carboxylase
MFRKVLIANRGAIACRIQRTLARLGVAAVAVYSDADAHAPHVRNAGESVRLGTEAAADSYLRGDAIIAAARATGADAIHPGYGFLSENADFAAACEAAGIAFVGPTPAQMRSFGLKHSARALARDNELPLLPGSGLLPDLDAALLEAARIGYPVMLKSTAGGGGIGMRLCSDAGELTRSFDAVRGLATANFSDGGVFLEKYVRNARHIEVQLFGDGRGNVIALGERDCSMQRRNQKVLEEAPAPGLSPGLRAALHAAAIRLGRAVGYRSAGTVEFVYDADDSRFYFLEVNTRLQVEHGVTEETFGVDLVEWMLRVAADDPPDLAAFIPAPRGHAVQARLYAEDAARGFRPSSGLLTQVQFAEGLRVDSWVETGTEVTTWYDPMLAKLIAWAPTRDEAIDKLAAALSTSQVHGIETNLPFLRVLLDNEQFRAGTPTTALLARLPFSTPGIEVVQPGTLTTVQDWPGRAGYWDVGVPPSGPMDARSLRLANRIAGNDEGTAALEMTATGATLRFSADALVALAGAPMLATLDGIAIASWQAVAIKAGSTLSLGAIEGAGQRSYLAVQGGFDLPSYLGSCSTFTLGQFGGHGGRALRTGDVLRLARPVPDLTRAAVMDPALIPQLTSRHELGVVEGPHGAPDFFTPRDMEMFFTTEWEVHYNSSRTGVRLIGPKPEWARTDGGEAGLHPSNIHDNAYAVGTIDFTGDMPVILGPDGPSLGGFVCPATICLADLWRVGQLRPGDRVRFHPVTVEEAQQQLVRQDREIATLGPMSAHAPTPARRHGASPGNPAVITRSAATSRHEAICIRRSGEDNLLVEFGAAELDLVLRFQVQALYESLRDRPLSGQQELTPGIRSLQVHFDPRRLGSTQMTDAVLRALADLPAVDSMRVASRIVHLPLSWDDPATRLATQRYIDSVRADAPWCPDNIEFIRRINGLDSVDDVRRIVFDASYLVMGLGDVYLGAPVATPLDPRHRLVTTKYNPARTWTPENAVGIGGAYMCVYGMEGPGGYQFVGRTVQMWNRFRQTPAFAGKPWLLRFFDQIRFHPVSAEALLKMRAEFPYGRHHIDIEETSLSMADYQRFLRENAPSIDAFRHTQRAAFAAERQRWHDAGLSEHAPQETAAPEAAQSLPPGCIGVAAPVAGSVWQIRVQPGQHVQTGDELVVLEAMKMEISVRAQCSGIVAALSCARGRPVHAGEVLVAVMPEKH